MSEKHRLNLKGWLLNREFVMLRIYTYKINDSICINDNKHLENPDGDEVFTTEELKKMLK